MMEPNTLLWRGYRAFRRQILCRLGFHGSRAGKRPGDPPANFCGWGCGHAFNPNAFRQWVVTLKSGETYEVEAINAFHAGSVVMYGQSPKVDARTGMPMTAPKVHRENILSAVPKPAPL